MGITRRHFLGLMGSGIGSNFLLSSNSQAVTTKHFTGYPGSIGVLHDISRCIGCRKCEDACNKVNDLPLPKRPFDDLKVLKRQRRPHANEYTVVNQFFPPAMNSPVFVKKQCNHCLEPACVSACFVKALTKSETGVVEYDPSLCVGCRYCMIACPFNIPAYEYNNPITPKVMKCNLCQPRIQKGLMPACVVICPKEALIFATRKELIKIARQRIQNHPDRYVDHVYGEHEMGGCSWLYISNVRFADIGMREDLGVISAPQLISGTLSMFPVVVSMGLVFLIGIYAISKQKDQIARKEKLDAVNRIVIDAQAEMKQKIIQLKEKAKKGKEVTVKRELKKVLEETSGTHASSLFSGNTKSEIQKNSQITNMSSSKKRSVFSPFNLIIGIIILVGGILTVLRFTGGLGAVTHLDDNNPWGLWVGFDLFCGVALAEGGYVTSAAFFMFGLKRFNSAVRPAILRTFLGYSLVVFALLYEVGQPWRLYYPIFISQGTSSLLFTLSFCIFLALPALAIESSPAALECLGWKNARNFMIKLILPLTFLGIILSILHSLSLGALFLIVPPKLHPLWYSSYLPVSFFVSSMFAGMSMVIFDSTLAYRFLHHKMDQTYLSESSHVTFGLGKAASFVMAGYIMIQLTGLATENDWGLLIGRWGVWYLLELIGFVALPVFFYAIGVRERSIRIVRWTALWTVLGVILNRFNVCLIAFNWQLPVEQRYFPSWMEIATTLFIVTVGVVVYRLITTRMPILYKHPDYQYDINRQ
jgi:Fe-S-cluster-containing dehydrogenase component/Ni/Fe-hydrogenase subunit HybB-like protein